MNIETLKAAIELLSVMQQGKTSSAEMEGAFTPHIGKRCIVRTYASGVFCGIVVAQSGRMVEIKDSRRLWSWKAESSISLSAVATVGVNPENCSFPMAVDTMTVLDALEIIPATEKALATIDACKVAVQK